ncbi:hypothetical protein JG687_00014301 [Phytophthora cactorum]|uniref:Uncharacterized protein n=1 Tax=Phytophthora cactorum TaxID=29920 RepID=A0A8T1TY29_9STRA|nr:hypothetical protein JG687_00014301 [Phytophthora cactorum]
MANHLPLPWPVSVVLMPRVCVVNKYQVKIATMLSLYNWHLTDSIRGNSRTNRKLDARLPMGVIVNQLKHCTVCRSNLDQHDMRYRIYCCKFESCLSALVPCKLS